MAEQFKAYESAYPGSMSERDDGLYVRRDDPHSLAVALLGIVGHQGRQIEDLEAALKEARDGSASRIRTCDACGSGPWSTSWDPESKDRESKKFFCPNCTGAT